MNTTFDELFLVIILITCVLSIVAYPADINFNNSLVTSFIIPTNVRMTQPYYSTSANGVGDLNDNSVKDFAFNALYSILIGSSSFLKADIVIVIWARL